MCFIINRLLPAFYLINVDKGELRKFIDEIFKENKIIYKKTKRTVLNIQYLNSEISIDTLSNLGSITSFSRKKKIKPINTLLYEELKKKYANKRTTKSPTISIGYFIAAGVLFVLFLYFSQNILEYIYLCY